MQTEIAKSMTVRELNCMTVRELRSLASELHIPGYWKVKKSVLIESLTNALKNNEDERKANEKKERIERAEVGLLVAFSLNGSNKIMTAKIVENNKKTLVVETKNGTRYFVGQEDIIWVKTGKRWPKQIYLELIKDRGASNEEKHCNR